MLKAKKGNVLKNQRGMTLLEIGAVIVIITVITFLAVRAVDGLMDQSRIGGVRGDFNDFQTAMESQLRASAGVKVDSTELNKYLDKKLALTGTTSPYPSTEKDPWDVTYKVTFSQKSASQNWSRIMVQSSGRNGTNEFTIASYYQNGLVSTCTSGFSDNNLELKGMTLTASCGGALN